MGMAMAKIICNGLGANPAYEKEVPTVPVFPTLNSIEGVQITIPLKAYERLINWASVSRTFDGLENALIDSQSFISSFSSCLDDHTRRLDESLDDMYDQLSDVRYALDECHQACRRHWQSLPKT